MAPRKPCPHRLLLDLLRNNGACRYMWKVGFSVLLFALTQVLVSPQRWSWQWESGARAWTTGEFPLLVYLEKMLWPEDTAREPGLKGRTSKPRGLVRRRSHTRQACTAEPCLLRIPETKRSEAGGESLCH